MVYEPTTTPVSSKTNTQPFSQTGQMLVYLNGWVFLMMMLMMMMSVDDDDDNDNDELLLLYG